MFYNRLRSIVTPLAVLFIFLASLAPSFAADKKKEKGKKKDDGFVAIFDGKTLDGWMPRAEGFWRVENGAITGETTADNPAPVNQFITWTKEKPGDFELKLKFRFTGEPKANGGIQIRSRVAEDGHVVGYQADMNKAGQYIGMLYDEKGRGIIAPRGTKAVVDAKGKKSNEPLPHAASLEGTNRDNDWNDYHIIARGNHITLKVNGLVTSELTDNQPSEREMSGVIAFQLHQGPPMKIEYKDIRLKLLSPERGFKPIFDGKTLNGWNAPDMRYWRVEDEAITGEVTDELPLKENQFLLWTEGELDDFELKLRFRLTGSEKANAGIQIRSRVADDGHVVGYQADIDMSGRYVGALYDERGRKMLANRGEKSTVGPDGKIQSEPLGDPDALFESVRIGDWNDYHVIARGNRIELKINGRTTAIVIDLQKSERDLSGVLALQLHSGPPMKIQYKDIRLKRLPLQDRKKLVFVAGPKTHGYAAHEHNAGCLLLAKLLSENVPEIQTAVYRDGWPADPTACDNADAICIFSDGGKAHVLNDPDAPLARFKKLDRLAKKGVGIALLHFAVIPPETEGAGAHMTDWIGGYYKLNWSVNPWWVAEIESLPKHPATRGVKPFAINDEWYYHIKFRDGMAGVTPLLSAVPPESTLARKDGPHSGNPAVRASKGQAQHLAWSVERPDGGRGFGFTGAHVHWNWAQDDFRALILNALTWTASLEVPPTGVPSKRPTLKDLEANQDFPPPKNFNREEVEGMISKMNAKPVH